MVNGGKTVVQAVAEGKDAAAMIAAYLNKQKGGIDYVIKERFIY